MRVYVCLCEIGILPPPPTLPTQPPTHPDGFGMKEISYEIYEIHWLIDWLNMFISSFLTKYICIKSHTYTENKTNRK